MANGKLSDQDLTTSLGSMSDEELDRMRRVVLAMLSGDLDVMLGADEVRTVMDAPEMLEKNRFWKNSEYAPGATGVKYIFGGGSPYPMSPGQSRARDITAASAIATNTIDRLAGLLGAYYDKQRRKKVGGMI